MIYGWDDHFDMIVEYRQLEAWEYEQKMKEDKEDGDEKSKQ